MTCRSPIIAAPPASMMQLNHPPNSTTSSAFFNRIDPKRTFRRSVPPAFFATPAGCRHPAKDGFGRMANEIAQRSHGRRQLRTLGSDRPIVEVEFRCQRHQRETLAALCGGCKGVAERIADAAPNDLAGERG